MPDRQNPAALAAAAPSHVSGVRERATSAPERLSLVDRIADWRNRMAASPGFQRWAGSFFLTRFIARRHARELFDLCSGFVYSQVLYAGVQLDLFGKLRNGPLSMVEIANAINLPIEGTERLVNAASALDLLETTQDGRWRLTVNGASIAPSTGLEKLIEHNQLLYRDLLDPVAMLRDPKRSQTAIAAYFPYGEARRPEDVDPEAAARYSELMASTVPPLAEEVMDAYPVARHRRMLDVGGGIGAFVTLMGERAPELQLMLFDLPAVAVHARAQMEANGLAHRAEVHAGNFQTDPLPRGADLVTLVRVLLDHGDEVALTVLRRAREALEPGGTLLVVEPFSGVRGAERVGDAYFGLYLFAMGRGRTRTVAQHQALLRAAGFSRTRIVPTRYPVHTGIIAAQA
ncbi:MAG TPA: methyltransferase [Gemmatimonadaceae bacterium]|nr:methyltransferase [Gemmatimonadaceae bacterium]